MSEDVAGPLVLLDLATPDQLPSLGDELSPAETREKTQENDSRVVLHSDTVNSNRNQSSNNT